MKEYNQRLLETVYWALGVLITVILFVAGAGWYVNFRLYERDKASIQTDLEALIKKQVASAFTLFRQNADQKLEEIKKLSFQSGEKAAENLSNKFEDLKHDIQYMRYQLLENEAKDWKAKEVYGNELMCYFRMSEIAKNFGGGWEWLLSNALEGLQNSLIRGAETDVEEKKDITRLLDGLGAEYSISVYAIKNLLQDQKRSPSG